MLTHTLAVNQTTGRSFSQSHTETRHVIAEQNTGNIIPGGRTRARKLSSLFKVQAGRVITGTSIIINKNSDTGNQEH